MSKQPKVNIYIDNQNLKLTPEMGKMLLKFAQSLGTLNQAKVYDILPNGKEKSDLNNLKNLGFQVISVISPIKDCADYQLVFDCIGDFYPNGRPNLIVIGSGDGDFCPFVDHLKKLGIKVIIFGRKGNAKQTLSKSAHQFYFIDDISQLVNKQNQTQNTGNKSNQKSPKNQSQGSQSKKAKNKNNQGGITYNEAIQCLIEAIQTASSQGKPTKLSYIDSLMRNNQRFPHYQGVASIRKPDGSKFSKLTKFLEAVEKDQKIHISRNNNQIDEVTLPGLFSFGMWRYSSFS
jgi:hypothetical protein